MAESRFESMGRGDPRRVRRSVVRDDRHIGYVTTIGYPDRDLTAFTEGSPHSEIVVADLAEQHVALFQRYKEHWLIQCGSCFKATERPGELSDAQTMEIAHLSLSLVTDAEFVRAGLLKERLDAMLPSPPG